MGFLFRCICSDVQMNSVGALTDQGDKEMSSGHGHESKKTPGGKDREAWHAAVHGAAKIWMQLNKNKNC